MGWLYGYDTRKDLIKHLVESNGQHVVKHCLKGNNLWMVVEHEGQWFLVLCLLRGRDTWDRRSGRYNSYGWGYKDIDSDAMPNYCNCPLSYLEGLAPPVSHGAEWRQQVRDYWAARSRKLEPGTKVQLYGKEYTVLEKYKGGYRVRDTGTGATYRLRAAQVANLEIIK